VGWAGVGSINSNNWFAIVYQADRTALAAVARELRNAIAAAIAVYPPRYALDQEALDEIRAERAEVERLQLEADQAVLDRVMSESTRPAQ
jgi:hypothetical protein